MGREKGRRVLSFRRKQVFEAALESSHLGQGESVVGVEGLGALGGFEGEPEVSLDGFAVFDPPGVLVDLGIGLAESDVGVGLVGMSLDKEAGEGEHPSGGAAGFVELIGMTLFRGHGAHEGEQHLAALGFVGRGNVWVGDGEEVLKRKHGPFLRCEVIGVGGSGCGKWVSVR